jgi:nucleolin
MQGSRRQPLGTNSPFKRVNPEEITFTKEGLADNSWAALRATGHTYADKAQERLGPVKGKAFQKEMTKAKRGTYRGGAIDMGAVNSIKFDN